MSHMADVAELVDAGEGHAKPLMRVRIPSSALWAVKTLGQLVHGLVESQERVRIPYRPRSVRHRCLPTGWTRTETRSYMMERNDTNIA